MIFRFGPFELSADDLRRDGESVPIQPKPLALLHLLVRERERVVGLEELFEALWPGIAVTPGSLNRAVSHARRAIGDTHRGELIRSYARRGYRFCGDVVEVAADGVPRTAPSASPPRSRERAPADGGVPFVGRGDALARLRDAWVRAAAGRGGVALVAGPPGIGKTRLTETFAREAEDLGVRVLVGRCREGEGVPALWLWAGVLRQLLAEQELGDEIRALAAGSTEIAGLLPELATGPASPRPPVSPEQSRFLFFDAVARSLSRCSRRRPLLLVLEDLHWAGAPSLRLLEHLAYGATDDPLLVLATVREGARERAHPLGRTLSILRQQEGCIQISLGGLTRGEVAGLLERLIGAPAPPDLTSELYARTEGVPLFLREAIRLLSERGELQHPQRLPKRGVTLPSHALDWIHRALDGLSEPAAGLVSAAAALGREFALPLAADVAELSREEALDRLDEAMRAGIVEAVPEVASTYRFVHALFQEGAYERLPEGHRARIHHRAARRLERQHADDLDRVIAELAHHHHCALAVGDPERAHEVALRAAARAAEVHAHEQAAIHYEQAAAALEHGEPVDAERLLETRLALGETYHRAGDRRRRREILRRAMGDARALGRASDFARAAIGFCDLSEWATRDEEARAVLQEALAGLGGDPSVERARLVTRLAYLDALVSRARAEPMARDAVELARALDHPEALQDALYVLHLVIGGPDDLEERREQSRELVAAAGASSSPYPTLIATLDLACDRLSVGDGAGAREMRALADRLAGDNPHFGLIWHMQVYDSGVALLEGRFHEVEERTRQAFLVGQRIEHPYARGCFDAHGVMLQRDLDQYDEALRIFDRALHARQGPTHWVRAVAGRCHHAAGRVEEARTLFEQIAVHDFDDIERNLRWTGTLVEIANLCADLGDATRAKALCARLASVEHHHGVLPMACCYGGPVSRGLARLLEVLGRADEAAELYGDALESSIALGARPMRARVLLEWGALRARLRERRAAADLLRESAELAGELGMRAVQARAEAVLGGAR